MGLAGSPGSVWESAGSPEWVSDGLPGWVSGPAGPPGSVWELAGRPELGLGGPWERGPGSGGPWEREPGRACWQALSREISAYRDYSDRKGIVRRLWP